MEGSGLVAKVKYTPLGDTLSTETAFVQAALALDVAAQFAVDCKDVGGLNNVAALYIELGNNLARMVEGEDEEDEEIDHEALERKIPLGFRPVGPEIVPVEFDEQEVIPAEKDDVDE
jgi:hypothetical protein